MKRSRRGSAYLLVLGASMLIVTVGVSAVMISKQRTSGAIARSEAMRARAGAITGISMALEAADRQSSWRETHAESSVCFVSQSDGVNIRVSATDPADGILDDDWTQPVRLRSTSTVGVGARTYEASFAPVIRGVDALDHVLCAGGDIIVSSSQLDAIGSVAAGGAIRVRSEDASATRWISRDGVRGLDSRENASQSSVAPQVPLSEAIDVLREQGVEIATTDLESIVLSENVNPWGRTSRSGVYIVDCRGGGARIANARIRGTLVFINANRGVRIEESVFIENSHQGLPALIVDGPCVFRLSDADLSESSLNMNFNPQGAPFDGDTDNDRRDSYGSMIIGTTWIRGDVMIQGEGFALEGSLIADGDVTIEASTTLRHVGMQTTLRGFAIREGWRRIDGSFARVTE